MASIKPLRWLTRAAVTAVVLMMTVTVDLMLLPGPTARAVDAKAIRVASSNLIIDRHYGWPAVVLATSGLRSAPYNWL